MSVDAWLCIGELALTSFLPFFKLKLEYENFYLSEPHRISDYWTSYLLSQLSWTPREKLTELESMLGWNLRIQSLTSGTKV